MNYQLPETGFLRLPQIIGDPKSNPPIPPIIPVKKSCWWDGVKTRKTFDRHNHNATHPLIVCFNLGKPSHDRQKKRGWQVGTRR